MAVFFTSDWHFGDNRMDILRRPFADCNEMAEVIIEKYNAKVTNQDTVFVLGDVFSKDSEPDVGLLERLHGEKILLKGNHDVHPDWAYKAFSKVYPDGEGLSIDVDGIASWMVHYPTLSRTDKFNLVGHIHGVWRVAKNALNVGIDAHHFEPLSESDIAFFYKAIDHYDDDAWISNHPAMKSHDHRGKTGSYFRGKI